MVNNYRIMSIILVFFSVSVKREEFEDDKFIEDKRQITYPRYKTRPYDTATMSFTN